MIKLKSLLPLNEFKSFNDKSRNMDTIRIKNKREHQRIMKTLDKWKTRYRVPDPAKGAYHIQFKNTKEAMMHRRRLEKAGFKIIDPNNEGKIKEAKETGIDIAKRIVKNHQHEKGVDVQTANLILKIHQAYAKNPALQKKFEKLPLKKLAQGVWRFVK